MAKSKKVKAKKKSVITLESLHAQLQDIEKTELNIEFYLSAAICDIRDLLVEMRDIKQLLLKAGRKKVKK